MQRNQQYLTNSVKSKIKLVKGQIQTDLDSFDLPEMDLDVPEIVTVQNLPSKRKRCHICAQNTKANKLNALSTSCNSCNKGVCKMHSKHIIKCTTCEEES